MLNSDKKSDIQIKNLISKNIIIYYYLSISLTGLPCHREPSIVLIFYVMLDKKFMFLLHT